MTKIHRAFEDGKAFIAFVTAGDPSLAVTEELILTMAEAGADLIEIGIPFSDPVAEGVVIQDANVRALAAGCTTDKIFDMVRRMRQKTDVPLVFLTYLNPIYTYGAEKFLANCEGCGLDGLIIPDMPFEEKDELGQAAQAHNVDLISMIAPTSHERIAMIAKEARGFIYCVSSLGVTGMRSEITTNVGEIVQVARKYSDIPCAVGFGISTPEQTREMAALSDGAIVGSAIVKLVAQYGNECIPYVREYVQKMKDAVRNA
ncbi:tryptophan synthase subunit alpha [Intestinibacillus massiliensis]|uniref:tryptophan synthase subunit alpha n=1 Tax=Intestinibacillus massiliensis TaxID=1871029 RepID=UPI000B3606D8|nr:tryptophan synthase subunit alpha [Intestinibacillus massiliensis]